MNTLLDNRHLDSLTTHFSGLIGNTRTDSSGKHNCHDFFPETAKKSGGVCKVDHTSERSGSPTWDNMGSGTKTVGSLLSTPAAQAVIEMGIEGQLVQVAMEAHLLETGCQYTSAQELYQAVSDIAESPEKLQELLFKVSQISKKVQDAKSDSMVEDAKPEPSPLKCSEHPSEMRPVCSENSENMSAKAHLKQRVRILATENKKLKEKKKCRSCKTVELTSSGVTFLPCGHFITCEACAEKHDNCPACNQTIMGTVRTFLA